MNLEWIMIQRQLHMRYSHFFHSVAFFRQIFFLYLCWGYKYFTISVRGSIILTSKSIPALKGLNLASHSNLHMFRNLYEAKSVKATLVI